jgi:hypothetical protein
MHITSANPAGGDKDQYFVLINPRCGQVYDLQIPVFRQKKRLQYEIPHEK